MTWFSSRYDAWSAILLLGSFASAFGDDLRVWTDATGAHTRTAAFLRIENGLVYLQLDGGSVLSIPLDRLSAADQEFARLAAEKIASSDPFEAVAEHPDRVVVVEGVGVDGASALADACREAVRQVVASFVNAEEIAAQHQAIEDQVVAISSKLVKKIDPIKEIKDGGSVRVRLKAHVRVHQVLELLEAAKISTDLLHAERLGSDLLASKPVTAADRAELLGQVSQPHLPDAEPKRIEVFYGTTRVGVEEAGRDVQYGSRSGRLSLGRCYVSIPPLHRVGELESPNILNF
jgi:hypothetical protein